MKKLLRFLFFLFISVFFFGKKVYAVEDVVLFWGVNCPYCHTVRENIQQERLSEKVKITEIEVEEDKSNLGVFREKLETCKADTSRAGIPMLFVENKCYEGVDAIMGKLRSMVSGESSNDDMEKVSSSNTTNKGKANTEKMIVAITLLLVLLPILGRFLEKDNGKKFSVILGFLFLPLFLAQPAYAICPLCTVAVGAGVGFTRYLGIDDSIAGIWIGGLLVSLTMWAYEWLKEKKGMKRVEKKWLILLVSAIMYALVLIPLKLSGMIGHPFNTLVGIDKILLGIVVGSVAFLLGGKLHFYIKGKNKGRVVIPFQRVVVPVGALLLATIMLYIIVYY